MIKSILVSDRHTFIFQKEHNGSGPKFGINISLILLKSMAHVFHRPSKYFTDSLSEINNVTF